MNIHADKQKKNKSQPVATTHTQKKDGEEATFQFIDNRPEAIAQRKLQEIANNSPQAKQAAQLQSMADNHAAKQQQPIQKKENDTGLPDNLKTGMENLSGLSLDDVKVHRNSNKPAQLQAHAYAQGTNIHLGPGQEKHLPHETWHVVQQKQGRVKPTMQMKDKVKVNDDVGLEREADVMGQKVQAIESSGNENRNIFQSKLSTQSKPNASPLQRKNNTDSPDNLKTGMEKLSGISLDGLKIQGNHEKAGSLQGQVGIIQRMLSKIGEDQGGENKELRNEISEYNEKLAEYEAEKSMETIQEIASKLYLLKKKLTDNDGGLRASIETAQAEVRKISLKFQAEADAEEEKSELAEEEYDENKPRISGRTKQGVASGTRGAAAAVNSVVNPANEMAQKLGTALPAMAEVAPPVAAGLSGVNMLRNTRKGMHAHARKGAIKKNIDNADDSTLELLTKVQKRQERKEKNMAVAATTDAAVVASTGLTIASVGWAAPALVTATAAKMAVSLKGPIKNLYKRVKGDQGKARKLLAIELYNKVRNGDENVISVFKDKSWGLIGPKHGFTEAVWQDPDEAQSDEIIKVIMRKLKVR